MKRQDALKRRQIFLDTCDLIRKDSVLSAAVANSVESLAVYHSEDYPEPEANLPFRATQVTVTEHRTLEAAALMHERLPQARLAVLNFANAYKAGGGVAEGAAAQEECLCRESTLFAVLSAPYAFKNFYRFNRYKTSYKGSDDLLYAPEIVVLKTAADFPESLPPEQWFKVDVITAAAPDLRSEEPVIFRGQDHSMSDAELFGLHVKRALHIFTVAACHQVDCLILGAFGCGVFKNNPRIVAKAYQTAISVFPKAFTEIEFAVYCAEDKTNYQAFCEEITAST